MGKKEQRKVARVDLDKPIPVTISSIGSEVRYHLETNNVSFNGFFLAFDKPGRFPFTETSILEVWLQIEAGEPLFFNGKLARVVLPAKEGKEKVQSGIAIRIIQIEAEAEKRLIAFVQRHLDALHPLPKSA